MSTAASTSPIPEYPTFSVQELVVQGKLLLASSGKEFIKPTILASSAEVKKARKEAMGRLGLDFLDDVADDIDLEKELADEEEDLDVDMELKQEEPTSPQVSRPPTRGVSEGLKADTSRTRSSTPAEHSPTTSSTPDIDPAMSARERNRLKRKNRDGNSAFVTGPPPQATGSKYKAAAAGPAKYVQRAVSPTRAYCVSELDWLHRTISHQILVLMVQEPTERPPIRWLSIPPRGVL